jgi:hypothetical protein
MRAISIFCVVAAVALALPEGGIPPRGKPADYAVNGSVEVKDVGKIAIGAAIVPSDQVRKMFSNETAQNYIVVEVAIYPEVRQIDASYYDFGLKIGDRFAHADSPADAALPWAEKASKPDDQSKVHVTQEAGVVLSKSNDPYYGRRSGVGGYEGTGVSNMPSNAPSSSSGPDRHAVEQKMRDKALPEGATPKAVAGYLYFPVYGKRKKGDALELDFTKESAELNLVLPAK